MGFFRIPWHVNGASPRKVLKLIVVPLCTSLLTCCIALNILIYVLVNFTKFSYSSFVLSYVSGVAASVSFILYVLAVIYGNYIFLFSSTALQIVLSFSLVGILVNFWRIKDLDQNVDLVVFNIIKWALTAFCFGLVFIEFRLTLVSIALGRAMFKKGVSWDLDDMDSVHNQFKTHTIDVY